MTTHPLYVRPQQAIIGGLLCRDSDKAETLYAKALWAKTDTGGLASTAQGHRNYMFLTERGQKHTDATFCAAIQIMAGAPLTKAKRARFTQLPNGNKCESCGDRVKNLQHILQVCPRVRGARIKRHDQVQALLEGSLKAKNRKFHKDNIIPMGGTVRKPDLVIIDENKISVVDPTIVSDSLSLHEAENNKAATYNTEEFKRALLKYFECEESHKIDQVEVVPILEPPKRSGLPAKFYLYLNMIFLMYMYRVCRHKPAHLNKLCFLMDGERPDLESSAGRYILPHRQTPLLPPVLPPWSPMDDIRDLKLLASEKAAGLGMDSIICFLKQAAKEPTAPKREGVKALTERQANWLKAIQARKMSDYARVLLSSALEALKAAIRQADIITPKDIMRCLFRNYNPLPKRMRSLLGAQFNYRCDANLSQCILALGTDGQGVTVNKIISDLIDNAVLGYRERNGLIKTSPRASRHSRKRIAVELKKDFSGTMRAIADGKLSKHLSSQPILTEVTRAWEATMSKPSLEDKRVVPPRDEPIYSAMFPITEEEVKKALPKEDAGEDPLGMDGRSFRSLQPAFLARYYNAMVAGEKPPQELYKCRTSLLPKVECPTLPSHYRPITVLPHYTRVFHRILARRLEAVEINGAQRGFRKINGCLENNTILKAVLTKASSRGGDGNKVHGVFLDFSKAFDSVSHQSVRWACRRLGIPDPLTDYFTEVLNMATTVLGRNAPLSINSGVLQGDPLSSLLFNFVLDGVLEEAMDQQGSRLDLYKLDGVPASACFTRTTQFCCLGPRRDSRTSWMLGLKLNPAKCRYFAAGRGTRSSRSTLGLGGSQLRQMSPDETQKYLGLLYSDEGVRTSNVTAGLRKGLDNISDANVSLQHKYWCVRDFLLPKFIYELSLGKVNSRDIETADHLVREYVRSFGRLPRCTPIEFFHAPTSMGGLGLLQFRSRAVVAKNGAAKAAAKSLDPLVQAAVRARPAELALSSCLIGGRPVTDKQSAKGQLAEELYRKIDTAGLASCKKGYRNSQFLTGGRFLIEDREFIAALQILGGAPFVNPKRPCEACPDTVKNLDHILQMIKRHDDVQSILEKDLSKRKVKFNKNNVIPVGNTVRKPDLVVLRGDKILVVDPTIISDKRDFGAAWEEKLSKYGNDEFKDALLKSLAELRAQALAVAAPARQAESFSGEDQQMLAKVSPPQSAMQGEQLTLSNTQHKKFLAALKGFVELRQYVSADCSAAAELDSFAYQMKQRKDTRQQNVPFQETPFQKKEIMDANDHIVPD
ncbi:Uncharacterized protein FKW44_014741 [Caligus rogercresseyi]|uniref:Reverse transcriptase domain-containing protein n=1 Tax=Caligus rogercresseyi TaxID=217165 RepID=A0A7T8K0N2_CALRO|nr:Uncharacterized protein FKW44_014741 [Caligus rogercresseyi]